MYVLGTILWLILTVLLLAIKLEKETARANSLATQELNRWAIVYCPSCGIGMFAHEWTVRKYCLICKSTEQPIGY